MKFHVLAPSVAALLLAAAPANAQSLSEAINAALAPTTVTIPGVTVPVTVNCGPLAGPARFRDTYQFLDNFPSANTVDFTNGETNTITTSSPPVNVADGVGRIFPVDASNFPDLERAVAEALSEAELIALFQRYNVQFIEVIRTPAGLFGAGLSGFCQSFTFRTNNNGNSGSAGGFAGGSSSASGRSVSSLSSAREQSSKQKKRKKKKSGRDSSYEDGYVRLASADGGVGLIADAAGVGPFGVQTFIDLRGGYTDIDRDATALESGFEGRSIWGQGGVTAQMSEYFAIAGAFAYSDAKGDFDAAGASGGANGFEEKNYTGSLFLLASLPFGPGLSLDLSAGGFYGGGDGEIERTFSVNRASTYRVDVFLDPLNPGAGVETIDLVRSSIISDDLLGSYDTRNYGFSAAASVSFDMGEFVVTPGVEFTHFTFKQDDYEETVADAFNNGLALSYSEFKDKWTETRIGGAVSRDFGPFRLEGYGDLVLTGGAATPTRTATFVEDLRANPYVLSYQVDALDKSFGVFGLVAAAGIGEGVEAFIGGETNVGHDYLTTRTIFGGVRFTP
jgi:hypothetical protein